MDILNKIKDLTKEKKWTIYKLSEASGIPQSTLSNMFTRKTLPSITTLNQLCEAFNITMSEFFIEESNTSSDELYVISKYRELSQKNKTITKDLINSMLKNQ
ncbi:MAG: helix-turn-helix transcriptional regulator [Clostridia bacterium]|nr:helix-turn-helix transcriptional regulator [Clostridia bacterium]